MRHTPDVLDYEGVFPSKRSRPGESEPVRNTVFEQPEIEHPSKYPIDSVTNADASPSFVELEAGKWQPKKGHALTFVCLFVFSVVLYLRPYELVPALSSFQTMAFYIGIVTLAVYAVSQLALEGNLTARPREVNMVLLIDIGNTHTHIGLANHQRVVRQANIATSHWLGRSGERLAGRFVGRAVIEGAALCSVVRTR